MQERGWTHPLEDRNGVSSRVECDKGDVRPIWETKVELAVGLHCEKRINVRSGKRNETGVVDSNGYTHLLLDENRVSSEFECDKRDGRTYWDTKME